MNLNDIEKRSDGLSVRWRELVMDGFVRDENDLDFDDLRNRDLVKAVSR